MVIQQKSIQIIGVPLDLGASRRGTDAGPSALRIAGLGPELQKMGYQLPIERNIAVPLLESKAEQEISSARFKKEILQVCIDLAEDTFKAMDDGHFPLIIGGDHSIAMGSVSAVSAFHKQKKEDIGLIWFDAHGDMNTPESSNSGNIHGMPLAHLLGEGDQDLINIFKTGANVKPENTVLIGIRDIDSRERERIKKSGIHTYTMRDIDERGMSEISKEALEIVTTHTAGFHLSFDLDGCDPTVIPGTGTKVPGGVNYREAHLLLELCAESKKMLAMDVVELNPFLDNKNISAERAVSLIRSAFGESIL